MKNYLIGLLVAILLLAPHNGFGATPLPEEISQWRLAADQGDAKAQYNLGVIYENGQGVPQNDTEATKWYLLAA